MLTMRTAKRKSYQRISTRPSSPFTCFTSTKVHILTRWKAVLQWDIAQIIPAHFDAPVKCSRKDFRKAFAFVLDREARYSVSSLYWYRSTKDFRKAFAFVLDREAWYSAYSLYWYKSPARYFSLLLALLVQNRKGLPQRRLPSCSIARRGTLNFLALLVQKYTY